MNAADARQHRKLQPIYNALDARNYKTALRLCAKKDLERWDVVKALKAHALERTGRRDEALEICRDVMTRNPTDEPTLNTLLITFKLTGQQGEATQCCESLVKLQPDSEEHAKELFGCYCRQRSFNKAQQLATRLFKLKQAPSYMFWVGAALALHVREVGADMKMLEVATRMLDKGFQLTQQAAGSDARHSSYEEVNLYLTLLKQQGNFEQALEALRVLVPRHLSARSDGALTNGAPSGPNAAIDDEDSMSSYNIIPMAERDRLTTEGALLLRLERYMEAARVYEEAVEVEPDQWSHWIGLLEASMNLEETSGHRPLTPLIQSTLGRVLCLQKGQSHLRAPYLAELELWCRMCAKAGPNAMVGGEEGVEQPTVATRLSLAVQAYVERFGSKPCCFDDMQPYIAVISALDVDSDVRKGLVMSLEQMAARSKLGRSAASQDRGTILSNLRRFICAHQLLRFIQSSGPILPLEELQRLFRDLSQEYDATVHMPSEVATGQKEPHHGDELLQLMSYVLLDLACVSEKESVAEATRRRVEACALLENGLETSPHNYRFRAALVGLYMDLGAGQAARVHWDGLGVKQIQLDTLSYLFLPRCLETGLFKEAEKRYEDLISIHSVWRRDADEYIAKAIDMGTYTKALEIHEFQRIRLDRSLQLALAKTQKAALQLLQKHNGLQEATVYLRQLASGLVPEALDMEVEWAHHGLLSDNTDSSVIQDWTRHSVPAVVQEKSTVQAKQDVSRVKMASMLSRVLMSVVQGDVQPVKDRLPGLKQLVQEFLASMIQPEDVEDEPDKTRHSSSTYRVAELSWELVLRSVEVFVLEPSLEQQRSDDDAALQEAIQASQAAITALRHEVLEQKKGSEVWQKIGLLDPAWVRDVSCFLSVTGSSTYLVLLRMAVTLYGSASSKRKGKKGKPAGSGELAKPCTNGGGGVATVVKVMVELLASFRDRVKAFNKLEGFDTDLEDTSMSSMQDGEAYAEVRADVMRKLRSSHRLWLEDTAELLQDKARTLSAVMP